jgi:hypothetical protein
MAHAADQFAASVSQWTSPAATAAAQEAYVVSTAAAYDAAELEIRAQYVERTT